MTEADLALALLLIGGFALLGALITYGNARQAQAIREVGEVLHEWAIRHIQLSRATAAGAIRIEDPVAWLQEALARLPLPEGITRGLASERQGRGWVLLQSAAGRLLLTRPEIDPAPLERGSRFASPVLPRGSLRKAQVLELSPVTAWPTFDLELAQAWKRWFPEDPPPDRVRLLIWPEGTNGR
ncbi:MAG: hypothetical protein NZM16_08130 [Thermoflexus sp.]|uniref:hypothetical protein n=1 Tax=Thermoflexus sp. TaxID=1969742 RepID=UPI0025D2DB1D|nr:hypothetical protein [Thermoflexus sp.]MCS6963999.1 hypothetical protein [Thermoflexus sp.]MDW8184159.1 hypothetical protein [Anaerolineae bacterium]